MQKLLLFFFLTFSISLNATLPEGAIAEPWTLDDINAVAHDLYGDYLDQGISVVMDMSATWCGPCWAFHQSGTMEDVWDDYGPNGGEGYMIMPMMLEVDPNTNQACLYGPAGCNNTTLGDWTAGIPYPIFNPPSAIASQINNDYNVTAYPTMYVVSPSGYVKPFVGSGTTYSDIVSWGANSFQMHNSTWTVGGDPCGLASIDFHPFQGEGTIEFEWSNGATTEDLSDLDDGDYYVTLTDDNGYEVEIGPISVNGTPPMTIDASEVTDVDCYGNTTGAVSVTASGGIGSFSYDWSNGDTGNSITGLFADNYDLTITDNNTGCEIYDNFVVFEPDEIEVVYEIVDAPCGSTMGSIEFDNEGGVDPFEYLINGTYYYDDEIELPADSYSADVIDVNGCTETASFTIGQQAAPAAASAATGTLNCTSTPVYVDGTGSATGANITYAWTDASGNNVGNGITAQVFSAGTYTLNVSDATSGCSSSSSVVVASNTAVPTSASSSSNNLTCNLPNTTLSGAGSATGANITYLWSTSDGNITSANNTINATANAAGTYNLLVTDTANGCTSTSSLTVTQSGLPGIVLNGSTSFCAGNSSNLCVPVAAGETIQWTQNGTVVGTSSCYSASSSTTYIVILTNTASGCSVSQTIQTTANPVPSAPVTGATQFCDGSSTTLCYTPEAGMTYQWLVNEVPSGSTTCITLDNSATVKLNVTNAFTGCGSTDIKTVVKNSLPSSSIAPPSSIDCNNSSSMLNLTSNAVGATFAWYDPAGVLISNMEDISVSQGGTYTANVTDANGCQSQSSVSVTADTNIPQISIDTPAMLDCNNSSSNINLNVDNTNYTINWYNSAGTLIASTEDITVSSADTYTAFVSNAAGCETQSSVVVSADTTLPSVSVANPANIDCNTSAVVLDANVTNATTIAWTDASGNPVGSSEDITVTAAGNYTVIVTNAAGCESQSSVTVNADTAVPSVSVATPANLDCNTSAVFLDANVGTAATVAWTDASGNSLGNSEDITISTAGTYTVLATNANGCSSQFSVTVNQIDNAIAEAAFSFANDEFVFNFADETVGDATSYAWNFGDGNTSTEASPMHTYDTPGYYDVCLETSNECGTTNTCTQVLAVAAFQNELETGNVNCFGANDGWATVASSGGLTDYSYAWSDPTLSGPGVANLGPGSYSVIVTDQLGTEQTLTFDITEPEELLASATITNTVSSASDGSVVLEISGGTGSYEVSWTDGGDGTNLPQGDYTATIVDENGCSYTETFTVEGTTSVNEINGLTSYTVNPNPASQFLNVNAVFEDARSVDLNIITALGERQYLTSSTGKIISEQIDLSDFVQGVYLIELRSGNQIATKRVIITK